MFNIFKKSTDKTAHIFSVSDRVFIPGIVDDLPILLVSSLKGQKLVRCCIVPAPNPEFKAVHGYDKFIAVTKEFMALSHREQIAEVCWSWLDYNNSIMDIIDVEKFNGVGIPVGVQFTYDVAGSTVNAMTTDTENIDRIVMIAGLVGKRAAMSVANYHEHIVRCTASNIVKEVAKEDKKAGERPVAYQRKVFSSEFKSNKTINKIVLKRTKEAGKQAFKDELAARAQTKKSEKDAAKGKKDIADEVSNVDWNEPTNDTGNTNPEPDPV